MPFYPIRDPLRWSKVGWHQRLGARNGGFAEHTREKKFIEHVEERLQKCVETLETDTSTHQIAQRMKNVIKTNPEYLKNCAKCFNRLMSPGLIYS